MAVPKQFKNYRDGFLAQGDPVGMTAGDFNLTGALTKTNPMHIDVRGLSLARLHGILSKKTSELSGLSTAVVSDGAATSVLTITSAGHGLPLNQMVSLSGAAGFADATSNANANGSYRVTAITEDTFTLTCSGLVTGAGGSVSWSALVAAKDASYAAGVVTVSVPEGHGLTSGQQILILDGSAWNVNAFATSGLVPGELNEYSRSREVTVVSPTSFSYAVDGLRNPGLVGRISYQCDPLFNQFKLFDGIQDGQRIALINSSDAAFSLDVSNVEILDKWIPAETDTIELYWSALKKKWVGLADQLREDSDMRSTTIILQPQDIQRVMSDADDYIELIPAPGPGKYTKVHECRLSKKAVGKQFVERECTNISYAARPTVAGSTCTGGETTLTVAVQHAAHDIDIGDVITVSAAAGWATPANINGTRTVTAMTPGVGFSFAIDVAGGTITGPATITYRTDMFVTTVPSDFLNQSTLSPEDRVVFSDIGAGSTNPAAFTSPNGVFGDSMIVRSVAANSFTVALYADPGFTPAGGGGPTDSARVTVINWTDSANFFYMFHDQGEGASNPGLNLMLPNNQVRDGFVNSVSDSKMILVPQADFLQGENIEIQDFSFAVPGETAARPNAVAGTTVDLENKSYVMNLLTTATGQPSPVGTFKPSYNGARNNQAAVPEWTLTLRYEIVTISAIGEIKS